MQVKKIWQDLKTKINFKLLWRGFLVGLLGVSLVFLLFFYNKRQKYQAYKKIFYQILKNKNYYQIVKQSETLEKAFLSYRDSKLFAQFERLQNIAKLKKLQKSLKNLKINPGTIPELRQVGGKDEKILKSRIVFVKNNKFYFFDDQEITNGGFTALEARSVPQTLKQSISLYSQKKKYILKKLYDISIKSKPLFFLYRLYPDVYLQVFLKQD